MRLRAVCDLVHGRMIYGLAVVMLFTLAAAPLSGQSPQSEISRLPFYKNYTVHRASSYDRSGANDDGNWSNKIQPGETRAIAALDGPGIITHIWITIAAQEQFHLKKLVLRMYWDGETNPSVEAPVGDFFGLGQ